MCYVKITVTDILSPESLKRWEDKMLEKPKCWNKFCYGLYGDNELRAVHVVKEGNEDNSYLTTLCEDYIKNNPGYGILVNDKHLVLELNRK